MLSKHQELRLYEKKALCLSPYGYLKPLPWLDKDGLGEVHFVRAVEVLLLSVLEIVTQMLISRRRYFHIRLLLVVTGQGGDLDLR